jgi:hypothetical protein
MCLKMITSTSLAGQQHSALCRPRQKQCPCITNHRHCYTTRRPLPDTYSSNTCCFVQPHHMNKPAVSSHHATGKAPQSLNECVFNTRAVLYVSRALTSPSRAHYSCHQHHRLMLYRSCLLACVLHLLIDHTVDARVGRLYLEAVL